MKVNYKHTSNLYQASQWLEELPELIACDFEVAPKYTPEQVKMAEFRLKNFKTMTWLERVKEEQIIKANGLSHVSQTVPTHLSVAWSPQDSIVIILNEESSRNYVCQWLADTDRKQIWHNFAYDGRIIYKYANRYPKNIEDTMLLAKCLTNHVEVYKCKTSLKELEGKSYGAWAISADYFKQDSMYDPDVIKYSATDSCATYNLYLDIQTDLQHPKWKIA